jgi:hypothetical protein
MEKLLKAIGATVGGGIGWWAGGHFGLMSGFLVSVLGTAAGVWAGIRMARS